jgi:hypothetical protein
MTKRESEKNYERKQEFYNSILGQTKNCGSPENPRRPIWARLIFLDTGHELFEFDQSLSSLSIIALDPNGSAIVKWDMELIRLILMVNRLAA